MNKLIRALACFSFLLIAPNLFAFEVTGGFGIAYQLHSSFKDPNAISIVEFALPPLHMGGFYFGGAGLHQLNGIGTTTPVVTYVGQGYKPFKFLKGWYASYQIANEGIYSGRPAHFVSVGGTIGK